MKGICMSAPHRLAAWIAALAALAGGGLAASCVKVNMSYPDAYVGPARAERAPPTGVPLPGAKPGPGETPAAPAAPPGPEAPKPPAPEKKLEPVKISVREAIVTALANNQSLVVQRLNPAIVQTAEVVEASLFDPAVTAGLSRTREVAQSRGGNASMAQTVTGTVGVGQRLPTGTTIGVDARTTASHGSFSGDDFFTSRLGLSVTQSLLRGYGMDVNLASLRQARLDTLATEYQLRGFAELLVAQVEETYWDYTLAQRQIEIYTQSLQLAERQLQETEERIRIGKLAEIERAASEAEVALRREELINAHSTLTTTRLRLLRLLNPKVPDPWSRDVTVETLPAVPEVKLEDIESHVRLAMRLRPDLNEARLRVSRGDLEIIKTRNGLLPVLDLFMTFGKSGYAGVFGESLGRVDQRGYDLTMGVSLEYSPLNRGAKALNSRSMLNRQQAVEAVGNLAQLAEVDVRTAYVEVNRAKEQVGATAVTRRLQEEKVRAETEKFRIGKSTTLLVAQAQRDLLVSQINEVKAVVAHLKALVEFFRLEGSLLERRGIEAPGREPVELTKNAQ
jgi:outer membrane protein TolC